VTRSALLLAVALIAAACERPSNKPPQFSLTDLEGNTVTLADYKGKIVLLDFWATWCGPCNEELPDLIRTYKERDPAKFDMLSFTTDEDEAVVKDFVARKAIPYTVVATHGELKDYDVRAYPTAILIDCKGRMMKHYRGKKDAVELKEDIAWAQDNCGKWEFWDLFSS
jgi:thiol-disulfide isomerase/thioredoxin